MTISNKAIPLATEEQCSKIYTKIQTLRKAGNVKVGINEVTKVLNDGKAQLVLISGDAIPFEVTQTLPILCEDKNVSYIHVRSMKSLGKACGVEKAAACVIFYSNDNEYKRNEKIVNELRITTA
ncbi:MAG: ribosomal L7Ae/L30e/S12e/Gadd45 family protein [Rickettsia endosymbiont of Ixodes persulcatus]|nr:ribosomal L7Ae/L30e/S12e/Gadd45 family protein [Rickettsia endosymbiont of Ixodes persulcatus]